MKISSKSELKNLIKECLVEILIDGIDLTQTSQIKENKHQQISKKQYNTRLRKDESNKINSNLQNAIMTNAGDNSIMQSILAETAKTTLPKQLNAESAIKPKINETTIENQYLENDKIESNLSKLAFNSPTPDLAKVVKHGFTL